MALITFLFSDLNAQTADPAAAIYSKVAPAVFVISIHDASGQTVSFGTGFLVGPNTFATNAHVVEGGAVFVEQGVVRIPGTVAKRDIASDLAIVKVDAEIAASPLSLSPTKVVPGQAIFVIGNPEGLEKSISTGVVAALRDQDGQQYIQITAPISHGSSGGPVLDGSGQVVGVTVAMLKDGQNLNFAIPVDKLRDLLVHHSSPSASDLSVIFAQIDDLDAAQSKLQYSNEPESDWQKTSRQMDTLFQSALGVAGDKPDLLVRVAEEAKGKAFDVEVAAAQQATKLKPSFKSNLLLGEGLQVQAAVADVPSKAELHERAEQAFRAAIKLSKDPGGDIYYDLADVLEDRGLFKESEVDFARAVQLSKVTPGSDVYAGSIRGLIRVTYDQKELDESEKWFKTLTDEGLVNAYDWQWRGDRLSASGKYQDAAASYVQAASGGAGWKNWCSAANAYVFLSNESNDDVLSSARECIKSATGVKGSEDFIAASHYKIARVLIQRGVYNEALSHVREAIDIDQSNGWFFDVEAEALLGLRRFQEAITAASEAIRLSDGKYSDMHFQLGRAYFELENWRFAEQSFEKAAELEPTDSASTYNVAICMKRLGYKLDAIKWFEETLRRNPQANDAPAIRKEISFLQATIQ